MLVYSVDTLFKYSGGLLPMPSWQSYVVNLLLRTTVRRKLAKISNAFEAREIFNKSLPVKIRGVKFINCSEGGINGEAAFTNQPTPNIILYLHGGGYFSCTPATYRRITGAFAKYGFRVFSPDYRLAPEHPFPAAVDDALAAYRGLLVAHKPEQIIIAGDSAGGGLALSLALAAREARLPLPAGMILFSPWTDLAGTGSSIKTNAKRDNFIIAERINEVAELYLAGADPKNPLASPLYGDLSNLPPVFIQASDQEVLLDDSVRLAEALKAAKGVVELQIWPNLPHVWQLGQTFLPEARQALRQAANFARKALASSYPTA